jgi:hypothetical protein
MLTQTKDQKIEKLEALILEMGHVIRSLDEETIHCEYWTMDGNENGPEYVHALLDINRYAVKSENSLAIVDPADVIKLILVIEGGNVQALHSTTDLQYVVVDVDDESIDTVLIGNVNTPHSVDTGLSLRTINIDLETNDDYQNHPWK